MNIPVVFTFDNNYALGGAVAIYSLLENAAHEACDARDISADANASANKGGGRKVIL